MLSTVAPLPCLMVSFSYDVPLKELQFVEMKMCLEGHFELSSELFSGSPSLHSNHVTSLLLELDHIALQPQQGKESSFADISAESEANSEQEATYAPHSASHSAFSRSGPPPVLYLNSVHELYRH